ncbi:B3 domain-containing protein REM10 [Linum grandiflorum]
MLFKISGSWRKPRERVYTKNREDIQKETIMVEMGSKILNSKPHFFQPLLPGFHDHFSIPVEFAKHLEGREVGYEDAVMRSPGGKLYRVKMNGRNFEAGWKEFVGEHDLHVGDFLVFRLVDAGMVFDVLVFEPSACERQYPSSKVDVKAELNEELPSPCPDVADHETRHDLSKLASHLLLWLIQDSETPIKRMEIGKDGPSGSVYPYFVVSVTPDKLERGRLNVPRNFAKMHGLEVKNCVGVVYNEEGRSWPVKINSYKYKNSCHTYIERGWMDFQRENWLKLGHTFNLELVQGGQNPVLRVSGLHSNPTVEKQYREKVKMKVIMKSIYHEPPASGFPYNHFFVGVTGPHLQGATLRIPKELAQYSGLSGERPTMILTDGDGGHWPVSVQKRKNGSVYIGRGWTELVKDNNLSAGDLLRMDLVERGMSPMIMFKVVSRMKIVSKQEEA